MMLQCYSTVPYANTAHQAQHFKLKIICFSDPFTIKNTTHSFSHCSKEDREQTPIVFGTLVLPHRHPKHRSKETPKSDKRISHAVPIQQDHTTAGSQSRCRCHNQFGDLLCIHPRNRRVEKGRQDQRRWRREEIHKPDHALRQ